MDEDLGQTGVNNGQNECKGVNNGQNESIMARNVNNGHRRQISSGIRDQY